MGNTRDITSIRPTRTGRHAARASTRLVLRQAIATQHRLTPSDRLELRACEGCGKPYLLTSIWLPHSEEGAITCPRCGAEAVEWDGARSYVAYWQRETEPRERLSSTRLSSH